MNIVLASRRKYMRKRTNPEGAPASVEDCIVSLVRDSFPYTGQPITPQVNVVTQDGVPLVVNVDYFVSYSDNVNVGAGVVIVTGTGEYVGSVTKTFQITSAAPSTDWDFDLSKTELVGSKSLTSAHSDASMRMFSFVEETGKIFFVNEIGNWIINLGNDMSLDGFSESNGTKTMFVYGKFAGFSRDGTLALIIKDDMSNVSLHTSAAAIPFDVESIRTSIKSGSSTYANGLGSCGFSKDGSHVFMSIGAGSVTIGTPSTSGLVRYDLTVPFDVRTGTISQFLDIAISDLGYSTGEVVTFNNAFISPNGSRVVVVMNRLIIVFGLETPFDISSRLVKIGEIDTYDTFSIGGIRTMLINNAGTKAIIVNNAKKIAELLLVK